MLLEELHGVFAKPAQQVVKLALVNVIDAEFVDGGGGWSGYRLSLTRGKPVRGREQGYRGKRLEQSASFHGRDCSRALRNVDGCGKELVVAFGTKWAYKKYGQRILSSETQ
jgi:hypothetical protein